MNTPLGIEDCDEVEAKKVLSFQEFSGVFEFLRLCAKRWTSAGVVTTGRYGTKKLPKR